MLGNAVVMIVLSRFSMKSAEATIIGTIMVRETGIARDPSRSDVARAAQVWAWWERRAAPSLASR
jgi:hypothetical protein